MMAFFLLLWLLNATTMDQKLGISNYFEPTGAIMGSSGSGGVFGGVSMTDPGVEATPGQTKETTVGSDHRPRTSSKTDQASRRARTGEERDAGGNKT